MMMKVVMVWSPTRRLREQNTRNKDIAKKRSIIKKLLKKNLNFMKCRLPSILSVHKLNTFVC